jgi:uncharacterized membrane protein YoaK (UPF0700 family)
MQRKWLILLILTFLAVAVVALGLFDKRVSDFFSGFAVGTAIGAVYAWFSERAKTR